MFEFLKSRKVFLFFICLFFVFSFVVSFNFVGAVYDDSVDSEKMEDKSEEIRGYIVEFDEDPLVIRSSELEEELEENKDYLDRASNFNPKKWYLRTFGVTDEKDVSKKVERHRNRLESEHIKLKNKIFKSAGISGNAVSDSSDDVGVVLGEYINVFNGVAVDVSAHEAEKIEKIKGVKRVSSNGRVEVLLDDSTPLIGANRVWNLDVNGGDCVETGDDCLTGEGIKIAILDTGVDHTHPDLGNGCFVPGGFSSGGSGGGSSSSSSSSSSGGRSNSVTGNAVESGCASLSSFFDGDVKANAFDLTERINAASRGESVSSNGASLSLCASESRDFSDEIEGLVEARGDLIGKLIEENPELALELPRLSEKVISSLSANVREDSLEEMDDLQGLLAAIHVDFFEEGKTRFDYFLIDNNDGGRKQLFSSLHLDPSLANSEISVHGLVLGDKVAVGLSVDDRKGGASKDNLVQALGVVEKSKTPQEENLGVQKTLVIVSGIRGVPYGHSVEEVEKLMFGEAKRVSVEIEEGASEVFLLDDVEYSLSLESVGIDEFDTDSFVLRIKLDDDISNLFVGEGESSSVYHNGASIRFKALSIEYNPDSSVPSRVNFEFHISSVRSYYIDNSYDESFIEGDVVGPYDLDDAAVYYGFWNIIEKSVEKASADVDINQYKRVVVFSPNGDDTAYCGAAYVGMGEYHDFAGQDIKISMAHNICFGLRTPIHEFGHNFGTGHASLYSCDGVEAHSGECVSNEYGDPSTVMGSGVGLFNSIHKSEVGWLSSENVVIAEEGEFTLKPLDSEQPKGVMQSVRVPIAIETNYYSSAANLYYSVELREENDHNNFPSPYVVGVYLGKYDESGYFTYLNSHMIPANRGGNALYLDIGEKFVNPLIGVEISLLELSDGEAKVKIDKVEGSTFDFGEPMAYYNFDDYSGGESVEDLSGNGDALVEGVVPLAGGLYFDGIDDSMISEGFANSFVLHQNEFTFSKWINFDEMSGGDYVLLLDSTFNMWHVEDKGSSKRLDFAISFKNELYGDLFDEFHVRYSYESSFDSGVWYHVAQTYDGETLKFYINGEEVESLDSGMAVGYENNVSVNKVHPLSSLSAPYGAKNTYFATSWYEGSIFNGIIDEVKIYANALSAEEVREEYESYIPAEVEYGPSDGGEFDPNCKIVGGWDFANDDNDPMDHQGHGTHVAATAAGKVLEYEDQGAKDVYSYTEGDSLDAGDIFVIARDGEEPRVLYYDTWVDWGSPDPIVFSFFDMNSGESHFASFDRDTKVVEKYPSIFEGYFIDFEKIERVGNKEKTWLINFYWGEGASAGNVGSVVSETSASLSDFESDGIAPDAKILAYNVIGGVSNFGWQDDVIEGIEAAVNDGADVISMSLGDPACAPDCSSDDPLSIASDNAVRAGVSVVIAGGNEGSIYGADGNLRSPGTSRKAITVAASDDFDNVADFSSRGPISWFDSEGDENILVKPDVIAPGVNICAARIGEGFRGDLCKYGTSHIVKSGTSMAAPHVSGAVALIKQAHPDWSPEEIKMALRNTAVSISGYDYGYSLHVRLSEIGESVSYELGGEEYSFNLLELSLDDGSAVMSVDGETKTVFEGEKYSFGEDDLEVSVSGVNKEGGLDPAHLSLNVKVVRNPTSDFDLKNLFSRGHGRIDVAAAVSLERRPVFAELGGIEAVSKRDFDILGSAKGMFFESYEVLLQREGSEDQLSLCFGNKEVNEGVLCEVSDFEGDSGRYLVVLKVFDDLGSESLDFGVLDYVDGGVEPEPEFCGDGIVNRNEVCDLGDENGLCPSLCSLSCEVNSCDEGGGSGAVCIDSDVDSNYPDGKNYFVKGVIVCGDSSHTDECANDDVLKEHYYDVEILGPNTEEYTCKEGCVDGACVIDDYVDPKTACLDSDSSNDLALRGNLVYENKEYSDKCEENGLSVREYFCNKDKLRSFVKRCPSGTSCSSGVCR